jgi:hypothetical protein
MDVLQGRRDKLSGYYEDSVFFGYTTVLQHANVRRAYVRDSGVLFFSWRFGLEKY